MQTATDGLVVQGNLQLNLAWINLFLLIGTLVASIIATVIAGRAVVVAREQIENSLQPRLSIKFGQMNWDPLKKGLDPLDIPDLLGDTDRDWTEFWFENHGEAAAYYTMVHIRHYWLDAADGYPPPINVLNIAASDFETFPEGNWISAGGKSQEWSIHPDRDTLNDPVPTTALRFWFVMGFVVYEGLHGVRYITRFCHYFHKDRKRWELGEPGEVSRYPYNGTRKITLSWFNRLKRERDFDAQQ